MKLRGDDTIVAIATPLGEGALSVLRLSGPSAISIADYVFRGRSPLSSSAGYTAHHGMLVDAEGSSIDEVVVTVYREPHSYTGEDSVDVSCHGGAYIARRVLDLLIDANARQAEPGEFTKRAFLNGKMDLTQAEAVSELIHAGGEAARRNSMMQLQGSLGREIREIKDGLTDICALLEMGLDFSEEGLELTSRPELVGRISSSIQRLQSLIESFSGGSVLKRGISVALVGPSNAGKSSLFNSLLLQDRAIVTPIAGTTRDTIEEAYSYRGIVFRVIDTAGLRDSDDEVEAEGMRRARDAANSADIVCRVVDATTATESEWEIHDARANQKAVLVLNKIDLVFSEQALGQHIRTSALTGYGIDALKEAFFRVAVGDHPALSSDSVIVTSSRHFEALKSAKESLAGALHGAFMGIPNEVVSVDMREAINALGELVGEVTSEDLLNRIFGSFCIGK